MWKMYRFISSVMTNRKYVRITATVQIVCSEAQPSNSSHGMLGCSTESRAGVNQTAPTQFWSVKARIHASNSSFCAQLITKANISFRKVTVQFTSIMNRKERGNVWLWVALSPCRSDWAISWQLRRTVGRMSVAESANSNRIWSL